MSTFARNVKLFLPNNNTRRFVLNEGTFSGFCKKVKEIGNIDLQTANDFKCSYLDKDNDKITMSTEEEFKECLNFHSDGTLMFKVSKMTDFAENQFVGDMNCMKGRGLFFGGFQRGNICRGGMKGRRMQKRMMKRGNFCRGGMQRNSMCNGMNGMMCNRGMNGMMCNNRGMNGMMCNNKGMNEMMWKKGQMMCNGGMMKRRGFFRGMMGMGRGMMGMGMKRGNFMSKEDQMKCIQDRIKFIEEELKKEGCPRKEMLEEKLEWLQMKYPQLAKKKDL